MGSGAHRFKGRIAIIDDVYLSGVDSYIESMYWDDTGEYLTKDEINQFIEENSSFIGEMIYEWCN